MSYTAKDALNDFQSILSVVNATKEENIDDTGNQGKVLEIEGTKIVVFLSPLGYNSSANKRYFDARDSGVKKRLVAYNYAKEKNYQFFYLGIRPELYGPDYVFSLECPEDILQETTGNLSGRRGAVGNQVNFNRKFQPTKSFERFTTQQDIFISCIHKEFLKYYLITYDNRQLIEFLDTDSVGSTSYNTELSTKFARNRILFGAPGTGKSYRLTQDMIRTKDIDEDRELYEGLLVGYEKNYERVTFHPDYSYANFVGTYKPVPIKDEDGRGSITYTYVPGPFMRSYVNAIRSAQTDNPEPFLLIIEEINRANVAAVFGDVFQLLDRDVKHISEYPIQASEDMKKYLADELGGEPEDYSEIRLPDNLFIWATMNSADQGVFPMDTAFKRRWNFTYLGVDENENQIEGDNVIIGQGENAREVKWNDLRKGINGILQSFKINEDKLMGPFFISKDVMNNSEKFIRTFKNKVIMYLFDDAAKHKRPELFKSSNPNIYSKICQEFDTKGLAIFGPEFANKFPKPVEANPSENQEDSNDTNEE